MNRALIPCPLLPKTGEGGTLVKNSAHAGSLRLEMGFAILEMRFESEVTNFWKKRTSFRRNARPKDGWPQASQTGQLWPVNIFNQPISL